MCRIDEQVLELGAALQLGPGREADDRTVLGCRKPIAQLLEDRRVERAFTDLQDASRAGGTAGQRCAEAGSAPNASVPAAAPATRARRVSG